MNKQTLAIQKYLSLAAAGLSLVSFYTTAQGLNEFVFQSKPWQAYIISGAIQISLFILNLKLLHYLKRKGVIAIILWILTLSASVTFSYVYISNEIYDDKLYYSDVDRIMTEKIMEISFETNDYLVAYKNYCKTVIDTYCSNLITENSQETSENNTVIHNALLNCQTTLTQTNLYKSNNTIMKVVVTELNILHESLSSNYSDSEIDTVLTSLDILKENLKAFFSNEEASKQTTYEIWLKINERLKQYSNFNDPAFISLQSENDKNQETINTHINNINEINSAISAIDSCITKIKDEKENNIINKITTIRQNLLLEMNKEELNSENIQTYMDEIYQVLIQENTSSTSYQLKNYYTFKEALALYSQLQMLQNQNQELLSVLDATRTNSPTTETSIFNFENPESIALWKEQWYQHLSNVRNILRECPLPQDLIIEIQAISDTHAELLTTDKNTITFIEREQLLNNISTMERNYLDNINKMEKAGNLLHSKYKAMALFSLIVALFLDVLGAAIGAFLYKQNPNYTHNLSVTPHENEDDADAALSTSLTTT